MGDGSKTVHVRITGRVQGVWFRAWTSEHAARLNLDGWVRNRRDGSVEAVFSGPAEKVDQMIELCRDGPPAATVSAIDVALKDEIPPAGFHPKPTQ